LALPTLDVDAITLVAARRAFKASVGLDVVESTQVHPMVPPSGRTGLYRVLELGLGFGLRREIQQPLEGAAVCSLTRQHLLPQMQSRYGTVVLCLQVEGSCNHGNEGLHLVALPVLGYMSSRSQDNGWGINAPNKRRGPQVDEACSRRDTPVYPPPLRFPPSSRVTSANTAPTVMTKVLASLASRPLYDRQKGPILLVNKNFQGQSSKTATHITNKMPSQQATPLQALVDG
jgi:hypothetical protein